MENASKALLIAGAILLSILIIAVGIAVFTSAKGTIDDAMNSMSEQEIIAFNSKFLSYQGESVSGTQVKALLSTLAVNFGRNKDEWHGRIPVISYHEKISTNRWSQRWSTTWDSENDNVDRMIELYNYRISYARNNLVKNTKKYIIEMKFDSSGLISEIAIKEK